MIFTTTSMKEVIGRVVRNTRIQDSSYYQDMPEWMAEAMGYMRTKYALKPCWKDVKVENFKARIPCGTIQLRAIQYGRCRLRYFNGMQPRDTAANTSPSVYPGIPVEGTTTFGTHLVKREATDTGEEVVFYETDLEKVNDLAYSEAWYFTELDYINTSFECGWIRVFIYSIPLDTEELPLIPDEENYKEALYWYTLAKIIGTGYVHKVYSEDTCMERFEKYAARARTRITYPTNDEQDAKVERMNRLIFPADYWSSFYNPTAEGGYA